MGQLKINVLGDLEVIREGEPVQLPPSKKTRALLAYLVLQNRAFRRETLCELLWEVPDDPRGSLRWSLSKLRRLVDEPDQPRIVADRSTVRFDADTVDVDLRQLEDALRDHAGLSTDAMEATVALYRGNPLEGLDLPNFHDFHSWCVATRESALRSQAALLTQLIGRLDEDSERALPHVRSLVGILPYDERARADLIRRLMETGRTDEAEQQVQLGERMLQEAGIDSSGELFRAWRGGPGGQREAPVRGVSPPERPARRVSERQQKRPEAEAGLVGRESECGRLRTLLGRVSSDSRCSALLIRGEPGIGKSRLLEWLAERVAESGGLLLTAGAFESETLRPYALWIDALRQLGEAESVFAEAQGENRDRLFANLSRYLQDRSAEQPVVVLFDDVQWADESSLAAAHYISRLCGNRPVLLVLSGREGELQDNGPLQQLLRGLRQDGRLEEVRLGSLSESAIQALIDARVPEADSAALCRECGGNPLLALELARAGAEGGGSLEELVAGRLGRFDLDGVELLQWAALLSPRIDLRRLTELTGLAAESIATTLAQAERQVILRATDQGFRFTHDLIASGIYAQIPPTRRQLMHRRAAELIEQDMSLDLEHAADLAHHALASSDPGLGARALVSAGKLCLRFFANEDALVLARRGLQLAAALSGAEQVCRRIELFDVMLTAAPVSDWEAAAEEYAALAELALGHGELAHARLGYHLSSTVRWAHGHWAGAQAETLQAEMITRGAGGVEHVVGMAETAKCLAMLERDLNQADALVMEARALSGSSLPYHTLPLAEGILRYNESRMDEAAALLREARTLCKSAGDHLSEYQSIEYQVMADIELGEFSSAREKTVPLIALGERMREGSEGPFALALEGVCTLALTGENAGLEAAAAQLREVDAKHRLAYVQNRAAEEDLAQGRKESAQLRAEEALGCAEALDRKSEMLIAHSVLHAIAEQSADEGAAAAHEAAIESLRQAAPAPWALNRTAGSGGAS